MLSHKTRRGLVLLAAVAGGALLVLAREQRAAAAAVARRAGPDGLRRRRGAVRRPDAPDGSRAGAYQHPTPSVHGLWPEVAPYGTSECAKPSLSTADPRRVVQCYGATGEGTSHIIDFETHEWEKHGECAGVRDARAYLTTVCGLAEQPLQAMTAARKAGGGLDAARRAVMGLGLEIFAVDEQHSQLLLSACSDGDTWTLSPVEKFPEACGQQRGAARRRPVWAVVCALALVFYVLGARGHGRRRRPVGEEGAAALTKQQLAMLEAGDKPSTGEKPSRRPPRRRGPRSLPFRLVGGELGRGRGRGAGGAHAHSPCSGEDAVQPRHLPHHAGARNGASYRQARSGTRCAPTLSSNHQGGDGHQHRQDRRAHVPRARPLREQVLAGSARGRGPKGTMAKEVKGLQLHQWRY